MEIEKRKNKRSDEEEKRGERINQSSIILSVTAILEIGEKRMATIAVTPITLIPSANKGGLLS